MQQQVAVVGGVRTPFVKAGTDFSRYNSLDLGVHVVQSAVKKLDLGKDGERIQELALGTVLLNPRTPNIARETIIQSGLASSIQGHAVSSNCITGLVAATMIADAIKSGRIQVGLAGGMESMSNPSLPLKPIAEKFYLSLARARSFPQSLRQFLRFRPGFIFPERPSPKEPSTGLTMGEHCELSAKEFSVGRDLQDWIALMSHKNAALAMQASGLSADISAFAGVQSDRMIRKDTSALSLAKLPPVFDRSGAGTITAGNSSGLTDGASVVCLMSEREAKKQGRDVLAYIDAIEFAAVKPADGLLMAPALAVPRLLERVGLGADAIDRFEIHEAFAAQVAANLTAWKRGWEKYPEVKPIGEIPSEKINVWGGSIALGHPFAATGGRLILNAARVLQEQDLKTCVISVCAAGGTACAMLLRRPL